MAILHLSSQRLKSPELQLLDGAFAAPHLLGNFPNTSLLKEASLQDVSLIVRQTLQQLREQCLPLGASGVRG
jgi:hypothetical protein